jgi:hypothetical protein
VPLKIPIMPAGTEQMVTQAIHRGRQLGMLPPVPAAAATGGGAAAPLSSAAPHPVFTMGLQDLLAGRGVAASARPAGWRVLVLAGQTAVAAVEFEAAPAAGGGGAAGGAPVAATFKSINQGRFVEGTVDGIRRAEADPKVRQHDYEVRLLEVPAVYLTAVWLHRPGDDLFVPLDPAPAGLNAGQVYGEQDLLRAVQPLARQQHQRDNAPQGPPPP